MPTESDLTFNKDEAHFSSTNGVPVSMGYKGVMYDIVPRVPAQPNYILKALEEMDPECEECGVKEHLHWVEDPFRAEILDDHTEMWLCDACIDSSCQDI